MDLQFKKPAYSDTAAELSPPVPEGAKTSPYYDDSDREPNQRRKLLEATLSVDEVLKRKSRKRRKPSIHTSLTEVDKMKQPLIILFSDILIFLSPREALFLSLTCTELKHVAKHYPRTKLVNKLHHFARLTYNQNVGLLALEYAYHKLCGICGVGFSGGFSKKIKGVYAHDSCIMQNLICFLHISQNYGLHESDFPPTIPIVSRPADTRTVNEESGHQYARKCLWKGFNEMVPLSWTFEWLLHHDNSITHKVVCRTCKLERTFALTKRKELNQALYIDEKVYPTYVDFAYHLSRSTDLFKGFFSDNVEHSLLSEDEAAERVKAVVNRGIALVRALEREKAFLRPIFQREGVEFHSSLDQIKKLLGSSMDKYFSRSLVDDGNDLQSILREWKMNLWNNLRIHRINLLDCDDKLVWIVRLRFEEIVGDYLTSWIPFVTLDEIRNRVFALEMSSEFKMSGEKIPTAAQIQTAFRLFYYHSQCSSELPPNWKARFLRIEGEKHMSVTERAIRLFRKIRMQISKTQSNIGNIHPHEY